MKKPTPAQLKYWESMKGRKLSIETRMKLSRLKKGVPCSEETKKKISKATIGKNSGNIPWNKGIKTNIRHEKQFKKGQIPWNKGKHLSEESRIKMSLKMKQRLSNPENHPLWKKDRSTLAKKQERNDTAYKDWRKQVWLRDKFTCRIADNNCDGKIEAHHILGWSEYPELRYQINNGITLCHAHHPKKRAEEKRLIPTFQELVSVLSE